MGGERNLTALFSDVAHISKKKEEKKKRKKVGGFETRTGELAALHSSVGVDNVNVNGHFREGRRRGRGRGVPI